MAIFHSKSHFNSAQSHLLVEERRRNNHLLVLLLLSVRISSLKNARNESSSRDCDLGLSKELGCRTAGTAVPGAEPAVPLCRGARLPTRPKELGCTCAICHLIVKYSGKLLVRMC